MTQQRRSPFKFLDAYTAADKDIFFGREREVEALYNMVFKTPMVLVYGLSGTGKTSLIQCGLAQRFDGPDWLPFSIRRGDDINDSLRAILHTASEKKEEVTDLAQIVETLFYTYFRPVYLIFDQFEELFILGEPAEQLQFMQDIRALIAAELPCKVLFVMREEYIGQLYDFEKILPAIFDYKLRVESLDNKRIKEVMRQSFQSFNISVDTSQKDLYQLMIDNISGHKSGIPLTYLQVYLDMLYLEDFKQTYPNGSEIALPKLEFTEAEITNFGKIDDVLDRYLKNKIVEIQTDLEKEFPNSPAHTVQVVLDVFVTQDGTKRPIGITQVQTSYLLDRAIAEQLQLPPKVLSFCIKNLEQARLLRISEDTIELGHDTLANLIDQKRTSEQRQLNDIKKRFLADYKSYEQTEEFLSEKRLNIYEEYLPLLLLSEAQKAFVATSQQFNVDKAAAKKAQQARELQLVKDKLTTEEKARKRQKIFSYWLAGAFIVALGFAYVAQDQWQKAVTERDKAEVARKSADDARRLAVNARDSLIKAKQVAEKEKLKREKADLTIIKKDFDRSLAQAEKLLDILNYEGVMGAIKLAIQHRVKYVAIAKDSQYFDQKIAYWQKKNEDLKQQFPNYESALKRAENLAKNKKYLTALAHYEKALQTNLGRKKLEPKVWGAIELGVKHYRDYATKHQNNGAGAGAAVATDNFGYALDLIRKAKQLPIQDATIQQQINQLK